MTKVLQPEINDTVTKENYKPKSLQTLQPTARDPKHPMRAKNMGHGEEKECTKEKPCKKSLMKITPDEKENASTLRRSKRRNALMDVVPNTESSKRNQNSTLVSAKVPKVKSKKGRSSNAQKPEQKTNLAKLSFSQIPIPSTSATKLAVSTCDKFKVTESQVPESSSLDPSILDMSTCDKFKVTESQVPESSSLDPSILDSKPINVVSESTSSLRSNNSAVKTPDNESALLTAEIAPLSFWKDLAEQRRRALESALHENELLHDQLAVLEAENSHWRNLVKEAEELASTVKEIIQ